VEEVDVLNITDVARFGAYATARREA